MRSHPVKKKAKRVWVYGPAIGLVVLVIGWSFFWFFVRGKIETTIEQQLTREAYSGRNWSCADRKIGGFPFRFEITCSTLTLQKQGLSVSLGPTRLLAQAYNPRHIIIHARSPFQFSNDEVSGTGDWKSLEASISNLRPGGFERLSIVMEQSSFNVKGLASDEVVTLSAGQTTMHLRPTPNTAANDESFDIAIAVRDAKSSYLDDWIGDQEPLQAELLATLTQTRGFRGKKLADIAEEWRDQGGRLKITKLDTRKGYRLLNLTADLTLDEQHRAEGTIQAAQANYGDILSLLNPSKKRNPKSLPPEAAKTPVSNLPLVHLTNGRIKLGMFTIPQIELRPLY